MDDREVAVEPFTFEAKLEIPFRQHPCCFLIRSRHIDAVNRLGRQRLPRAGLPYHHGASTIIALGDRAFKVVVRNGMVFDLHREALVRGVE